MRGEVHVFIFSAAPLRTRSTGAPSCTRSRAPRLGEAEKKPIAV